ncbi:branched-chain amino acid ABC transporter permease [bacterium]|nr:MAG: branched-chain amino acid ABC transporter permease [bacterium]
MSRRSYLPFAALIAIVAVVPLVVRYPTLEAQILTAGMLALGFSLLLGQMGFLSFGQATFNGAGAYAAALAALHWHAALPLLLLAGIAGGVVSALVVGTLSIMGTGVYAVMLTFALNEMAFYAAFELKGITGGDNGLRGFVRPDFLGIHLNGELAYYYVVAVVFALAFYLVLRIVDSPFGHVLRAIRENEQRAKAIGYDVRRFKVAAFAVSGALSGLAGALYALLYQFVPLEAIDFNTSTNIVVMGLLGGVGSPYGPILGAAIYTVLANFLSTIWARWPLLLGVLFCCIVLFLRGGLWELGPLLRRAFLSMGGGGVAADTKPL